MLRELGTDDGGLASALDADSEGEEGRFYVWTSTRSGAVLADAGLDAATADALTAYWGVTPGGNWEGRTILTVAGRAAGAGGRSKPAARPCWPRGSDASARRATESSWPPGTGWRCARSPPWPWCSATSGTLRPRDGCVGFVRAHLLRDGDRVWRTARDGRAHTPGFAEDYANLADGLLAAHAALGEPDDLGLAVRLMDRLIADFWDEASGTLFDTAEEHDRAVTRPRSIVDSATPSANAVAADVLLRLALLTGEADYDRRARSILRAVAPALDRQPSAFGRMLSAVDRSLAARRSMRWSPATPTDEAAAALRRAVAGPYVPDLVIAGAPPDGSLAGWPLFEGKLARDGQATAYVCRGYACEAPTTDPREAAAQVARLALSPAGS